MRKAGSKRRRSGEPAQMPKTSAAVVSPTLSAVVRAESLRFSTLVRSSGPSRALRRRGRPGEAVLHRRKDVRGGRGDARSTLRWVRCMKDACGFSGLRVEVLERAGWLQLLLAGIAHETPRAPQAAAAAAAAAAQRPTAAGPAQPSMPHKHSRITAIAHTHDCCCSRGRDARRPGAAGLRRARTLVRPCAGRAGWAGGRSVSSRCWGWQRAERCKNLGGELVLACGLRVVDAVLRLARCAGRREATCSPVWSRAQHQPQRPPTERPRRKCDWGEGKGKNAGRDSRRLGEV